MVGNSDIFWGWKVGVYLDQYIKVWLGLSEELSFVGVGFGL